MPVRAAGTPGCPAPPRGARPGRCLRGQRRPFPAPPAGLAPRPRPHPRSESPYPAGAGPRGRPHIHPGPARRWATPGSSGKGPRRCRGELSAGGCNYGARHPPAGRRAVPAGSCSSARAGEPPAPAGSAPRPRGIAAPAGLEKPSESSEPSP